MPAVASAAAIPATPPLTAIPPGHSDIEVTMTIYAHAAIGEKRKALGKLGDALG